MDFEPLNSELPKKVKLWAEACAEHVGNRRSFEQVELMETHCTRVCVRAPGACVGGEVLRRRVVLPCSLKHAALRAAEMVVGGGSGGGRTTFSHGTHAPRDSDEGDRVGAPKMAEQWTCSKCSFRQKCSKALACYYHTISR